MTVLEEIEALRDALGEIAASHIPDQSAAAGGDDLTHAQRHVARLRGIAQRALAETAADGASVIDEIAAERRRQIEVEGWTPDHDDEHANGEIAAAASCYAASACLMACEPADAYPQGAPPAAWPWSQTWWKPRGARRDLIRAGALIVAEIERLDRRAGESGRGRWDGED